ncbi:Ran-binding-domain-containing protein [Macroventuria anomochaeta]|uniref:Ran-binding-domain-containing protein n=1 Tax=Macroventuria anomochaeta TaxID=301207 RepID=A0ACB6RSB6_9PLEO|nr:Ran-binding-domain-containing protein [Macroventuria anomochaeta]KAF2624587.1 Ran-binding-domain-containing protein [Macroventuria anomochaeta]
MEVLLAKVTQQAMSYAIRSGIAITSTYAIKQCGRLMKTVDGQEKQELAALQSRLDSKIKIISPAIDMIELISARGNTTLESAVTLTKSLRWDIQSLGSRVEKAVVEEQLSRRGSSRAKSRAQNDMELRMIIAEMKQLLARIEDAVPLINLAITTSGVSLSTNLPPTVSPSRLLQASTFLTAGDSHYCMSKPRAQQIGPTFTLSMYMLFSGYAVPTHDELLRQRETTWKEVMHKARVTLLRVPLENVYDYPVPFSTKASKADEGNHRHIPSESALQEFAYQLLIVEDLDDGRVHTFEDDEPQPGPYDGVDQAGVREIIPIHEISKIFYADTGKILNIGGDGEANNPILLLKRDVNAPPPRRMMEHEPTDTGYESDDSHTVGEGDDEQSELDAQFRRESTADLAEEEAVQAESATYPWRLPPTLDLEWMAFEVYQEELDSDSDFDDTGEPALDISTPSAADTAASRSRSESPGLLSSLSNLNLHPSTPPSQSGQLVPSPEKSAIPTHATSTPPTTLPPIKTSLSMLEMLIRLTALQQFQQSSHLAIPDEFLTFFLSESSTVGSGGDSELRRRARREARQRVGFDPYDESPIKRRGEEYQARARHEEREGLSQDREEYEEGRGGEVQYDYVGYPTGSRSGMSTPYSQSGTPNPPSTGRSKSTVDVSSLSRPSHASMSSPSPLLRRATTQTGQEKSSRFRQPRFPPPQPQTPPSS